VHGPDEPGPFALELAGALADPLTLVFETAMQGGEWVDEYDDNKAVVGERVALGLFFENSGYKEERLREVRSRAAAAVGRREYRWPRSE
jgi:hypothetical protein